MSDFLHNLRTGNMKRFDRPRKNFDNPQYRQHTKDRKSNYQKKVHTGDQLQDINKHLEGIAQTIENNLKTQEKTAAALERIARVLEAATGIKPIDTIVRDDLARQPNGEPQAVLETDDKTPEMGVPSNDSLLATITEMRNGGASFDKIAAELEKRTIPTVSGRGKWRGQAVSKFLKESA
jgi:hypothetical protein